MTKNLLMVTGVSGSGKDYLLEQSKQFDHRLGSEIPIVSMGSAILTKLIESDRDKIKHLVSNEVMKGIVRSILADLADYPAAVMNGHITYRQQGELVSNPDIDTEINPASYAVIVAEPKDIVEWRSQDTSRRREFEAIDEIAYHQDFTIQTAESIATVLGAGYRLIENVSGNTDESARTLATMVSEICPKL